MGKSYVDGSSTIGKGGAGIVLIDHKDAETEYAVYLGFRASSNEAEYEALIDGLEIAAKNGVEQLHLFYDSQLMVQQMNEAYITKDERMAAYVEEAKEIMGKWKVCTIEQIPRDDNQKADFFANIGSLALGTSERKITPPYGSNRANNLDIATLAEVVDWRMPIIQHLSGLTLPSRKEQVTMECKCKYLYLQEGIFFKRGFTQAYLRCLN